MRLTDRMPAAVAAFRRGDHDRATALCRELVQYEPAHTQAWVLLAKLAQARSDFTDMLASADHGARSARQDIKVQLLLAEAEVLNGQLNKARARVDQLSRSARSAEHWAALGQFYTAAADHDAALQAYREAARLAPGSAAAQVNLATALVTTGELTAAEALLDNVLADYPDDADAHYQRATLRRATPADNHLASLRSACARQPADNPALCYALAREYEDCAQYQAAWDFTQRGAAARRAQLAYRVERDEQAMAGIAGHLDANWQHSAAPGAAGNTPIFVLGLPRSGTTLVDRILASHDSVGSIGEVNDFAYALIRCAGPHRQRQELIERAPGVSPALLGERYLSSIRQYRSDGTRVVDKTPLNFLYLGLIRAALPDARIVHVRRHPVASCHALYKTLFRMACPFSYDLDDLARYYLAYRRLMDHWHEVLGDAWLTIDYETLVTKPEPAARELLTYCGLPWQDSCLNFHRNPAPVATASSAQVREPIHTGSVGLWRHYQRGLAPLIERLERGGVDLA